MNTANSLTINDVKSYIDINWERTFSKAIILKSEIELTSKIKQES